ncbi:glycosyltransferase family 4 protein [Janthinobacterium aquaticum]|uniref:glycosyltransferase family 4 protein n=1 Tax=Janthinobacterium sp. FT58W TaxID=2654254 RepID=UPI001265147B|nr:glycosyltransferase family 4 protein [Janthinobacterium sp. FT58W]KAB8043999.1 glycosyltransferase [Janthinobacterium sp. FT58W]
MKILHLCLSCFYIDGYAYQENMLVAEHVRAGHDVHVVASTETFGRDGKLTYVTPSSYMGSDGAMVERLPYRFASISRLAKKIRAYTGLTARLEAMAPDVIVFHGLCSYALAEVSRYVQQNPGTALYADSHEDFNNSARGWVSKWLLHFMFYRTIFQMALPSIRSVFCISKETELFVRNFYGCPAAKAEFLPLGGKVFSDDAYTRVRQTVRAQYQWGDDLRIFVQSGKFDGAKRLLDSLNAFSALPDQNLRLVLAGVFMDDIKDAAEDLVRKDPRIIKLGWLDTQGLTKLLIGADVYVQPGSQSATMQMAVCCRKPVIIADVLSHRALIASNGWLVSSNQSLYDALLSAAQMQQSELESMSAQSAKIAASILDYALQAEKLT